MQATEGTYMADKQKNFMTDDVEEVAEVLESVPEASAGKKGNLLTESEKKRIGNKAMFIYLAIFIVFVVLANVPSFFANTAPVPAASEDLVGIDAEAVAQDFEDAGFTDVELVPMEDIAPGAEGQSQEGTVGEVTIGGEGFDEGSLYVRDAEVRIIYHSIRE